MPPEASGSRDPDLTLPLTGRCYCGAVRLTVAAPPVTVAYCHCTDCRRWTGAPVGAFAAVEEHGLEVDPPLGPGLTVVAGVERWTCPTCGSPLAARFDYLPGQIYVPVGVLDQAADLAPRIHAHFGARLPWLCLNDDLPRSEASARADLNGARKGRE